MTPIHRYVKSLIVTAVVARRILSHSNGIENVIRSYHQLHFVKEQKDYFHDGSGLARSVSLFHVERHLDVIITVSIREPISESHTRQPES